MITYHVQPYLIQVLQLPYSLRRYNVNLTFQPRPLSHTIITLGPPVIPYPYWELFRLIVSDRKIWPTPAIVVSSVAHPFILRLNFLKLIKSKIDFETNNVETGSEIYPEDMRCITSFNSTIIITDI